LVKQRVFIDFINEFYKWAAMQVHAEVAIRPEFPEHVRNFGVKIYVQKLF